jgi:hypothetical protein
VETVIGILSVKSLGSLYVAFELGARWGAEKPLIPLMAPGFQPDDIKGPLGGKNALAAGSAGQLHDLVVEVGKQLEITFVSAMVSISSFASTLAQPKDRSERSSEQR